jgi:hypothetical protein
MESTGPKWSIQHFCSTVRFHSLHASARMQTMETFVVIVGTDGEFELPQPIRDSLKIVEGTRVSFEIEGSRIILTPQTESEEPVGSQKLAE